MSQTINLSIGANQIDHIILLGLISLVISTVITPIYTTIAYRRKWWKQPRVNDINGNKAEVYTKLHEEKHRRNIPTMAGLIFITSIALVTLFANLNRGQTWLPLAGMVGSGAIGLIDDLINIRGINILVGGMKAKVKFLLHSIVALVGGWWFFAKLGVTGIYIPGLSEAHIGIFVILLFWFVVIATANAVNITDGLDGLAGGLLASSFAAYGFISGVEHRYDLAAFCFTVVGALLSYTWFNIFPARFFMGDIGAFGLGTALGIIAMQTDTVYVLPIIGIVYVAETGSVIINFISKKLRQGKKVFISSPVHYHFQAKGWPETKVTMRFWLIGQIGAITGLVIFLLRKF